MSRKLTLTLALATIATIAAASLGSSSADARGFGGGHFGGGHFGGAHFGGGHFGGAHFGGGRTGSGSQMGGRSGRMASGSQMGGRGSRTGGGSQMSGRGGHVAGKGGGKGGFSGRTGGFANHGHWVFRDGRWIILSDMVGEAPVLAVGDAPISSPVAAANSCSCLTKNYTAAGLVVFADTCTREAASAPVDGSAPDVTPSPPIEQKSSEATQAPTSQNYAGLTYQKYLAVKQQAASAVPPKD